LKFANAYSAFATVLALAAPGAQAQGDPDTPTTAKGVQVISVEEAQDLLGKAQFFDCRAGVNYGKGHIKGAVALPYTQRSAKSEKFDASKDTFAIARLPEDKSVAIVFYGDAASAWKSYKAAIVAARAGYSNVKWMRDGVSGWTARGLPLE
jgi:rhodanese-related sulfurtransferase